MDPSLPPPPKTSRRKCECECPPACQCHCTCRVHCSCLGKDCDGNCYKAPTRNLVVSIDGTSNQFGLYNTHVVELHKHIRKDDPMKKQLAFYVSGIGTFAPPSFWSFSYWKQRIGNAVDLAIAWNFEQQVQDAYRWLADNYQPGDKIYLFGTSLHPCWVHTSDKFVGFSRGAYQVRALAGMIEKMGLIYSGNHRLIPFAYELYTKRLKGQDTLGDDGEALCRHFKDTFSRKIGPKYEHGVQVHFVGAWDTVSSVGIFRGQPLPLTSSADHLCIFRHALALDERRVRFLPEYIIGGDSQTSESLETAEDNGSSETGNTAVPIGPQLKDSPEIWFAGTHSDIGGGNKKNTELNLGRVPLLWMENEASKAGLGLEPRNDGGVWNWDQLTDEEPTESLAGLFWRLLEKLPLTRSAYNLEKPDETQWWPPHNGRGRVILPGQVVHASVAFKGRDKNVKSNNGKVEDQKLKKDKDEGGKLKYTPKASLLNSDLEWKDLVGKGKEDDISWAATWHLRLDLDLFDSSTARDVGQRLVNAKDEKINHYLKRIPLLTLTGKILVSSSSKCSS
ncbi:hypothetical protein FB451DRAFT_1034201 [Mycena latifolia]|nr:hypothetical protein FB451DRAFT_1034201 [Mycena latifolia]